MAFVIGNIVKGLYNAVFRPAALVTVPTGGPDRSLPAKVDQAFRLGIVYLVNLTLYAGPLTVAGIGIGSGQSIPPWLAGFTGTEPGALLRFLAGFVQNSLYLLGITVATLVGAHIALVITLQSKGFLRTAHSVVYSTSIYLAGIFTVVWYLTSAEGVATAREFVINVQVAFIYRMIDLTESDLVFGIDRPDVIVPGEFSTTGEYAIIVLALLLVYYFYSLYLGTRLNHDAGRFEGVLVVLIVILLPITYVIGSIILATIQSGSFGI